MLTSHIASTKIETKELAKLLIKETDRLLDERIDSAVKEFESKLGQINDSALDDIQKHIQETKTVALINLTGALLVMATAVVMVFKFTFY